MDEIQKQIAAQMRTLVDQATNRLLGVVEASTWGDKPAPRVTFDDVRRGIEMSLRQMETQDFVLVHPDTWPEMRAKLEASGIPVFDGEPAYEGGPVTRFWVGGQRYEHSWPDELGVMHHSVHHTGAPCYLQSAVEPGTMVHVPAPTDLFKIMPYEPPPDRFGGYMGRWRRW